MRRDFADFWNLLWELALGVCAAFALLNLLAPQQDLPWKPLDLSQPIGTATAAKVADFVLPPTAAPEEITAVTGACMQVLREAGARVDVAFDSAVGAMAGFVSVAPATGHLDQLAVSRRHRGSGDHRRGRHPPARKSGPAVPAGGAVRHLGAPGAAAGG